MIRYLLAAAAVAAIAISGAAFAEDGKITSTAPKAMSDSELEKVTAGIGAPNGASDYGLSQAEGAKFPGFSGSNHPCGKGRGNGDPGCL